MSVYRAVRHFPDYPQPQGSNATHQPTTPALSARQAAWLLVDDPAHLTEEQGRRLQALCEQCAEAAIVYPLAQRFVAMLKQRQVEDLDPWLHDALTCGVTTFRHFVVNLQQDHAAVKAAFSLEVSNGQVEGQVNRLKVIKRVMYGRAKSDLLRVRVLHPP